MGEEPLQCFKWKGDFYLDYTWWKSNKTLNQTSQQEKDSNLSRKMGKAYQQET